MSMPTKALLPYMLEDYRRVKFHTYFNRFGQCLRKINNSNNNHNNKILVSIHKLKLIHY